MIWKRSFFNGIKNVKYFGIDKNTKESVGKQVLVFFYEKENNFAIKLLTKGNDEVIISKGLHNSTFKDTYNEILSKKASYLGNTSFGEEDLLMIPNINFKTKKEFTELENKKFYFSNGNEYYISKALQTIEFDLDKSGGKIKSEAGMVVNKMLIDNNDIRYFNVNSEFSIFLKENDKNLPYFAARINNIKNVQDFN